MIKKLFSYSEKGRDFGLLFIRMGMGILFMVHGWPKIAGGAEKWAKLGGAMEHIGITFLPTFWGFMAAFAEFGGGALMALGLFFRPSMALLAFTMFIATVVHLAGGDGLNGASHALEALILFKGMWLVGPGRFSLDERLLRPKLGQ